MLARRVYKARSEQVGATLVETMIALALSTVVTSAMVVLMGNTVGTSSRIIGMTQMGDELRSVMSMLTRDIRRANYSANALYCYGHANCGDTVAPQSSDILVQETDDVQCVTYQLDRSYINEDGDWQEIDGNARNDPKGGFRRREIEVDGDARGIIEMWVGAASDDMPVCDPDVTAGWLPVTNPNMVDVILFDIVEQSTDEEIEQQSGVSFTQRQRQLDFVLEGELILEQKMGWVKEDDPIMVRRRIEDTIAVRNDYIANYTPAP